MADAARRLKPVEDAVVWEDPPPERPGGRGKWTERLHPLTQRPGAWARVQDYTEYSSATAARGNLGTGRIRTPAGRWEFAARRNPTGGGSLYARYLGPEDAA